MLKVYNVRLGGVAHICIPTYTGGGDPEAGCLRSARVKSSQDPNSTNKKLGMVEHTCHLQLLWEVQEEDLGPGLPGHKCEILFKKYLKKKDLGVEGGG
jgi:hypothetical protein